MDKICFSLAAISNPESVYNFVHLHKSMRVLSGQTVVHFFQHTVMVSHDNVVFHFNTFNGSAKKKQKTAV